MKSSKMEVSAINAYKTVLSVFNNSDSDRVEPMVEVEVAEMQTRNLAFPIIDTFTSQNFFDLVCNLQNIG